MKLRNQILSLGLGGALAAALVGGIGLLSANKLAGSLDQTVSVNLQQQSHMTADMMHDTIRSDVLLAILGAANKDAAQLKEAQTALADHTSKLEGALRDLNALPIADEVKIKLDNSTALMKPYAEAGATMTEVVNSIRHVTDIMGKISAACSKQAAGVAQVGEDVTQMDRAIQQNSALVEEMAGAARSLNSQEQELVQTVAVFKLGSDFAKQTHPPKAVSITPHVAERRGPNRATNVARIATQTQAKTTPTANKNGTDEEWTSF